MNKQEADAALAIEQNCRICNSPLTMAIERWGAWWSFCNHCGVEIPLQAIISFPKYANFMERVRVATMQNKDEAAMNREDRLMLKMLPGYGNVTDANWRDATVTVVGRGWTFRAPFRCMCCGSIISMEQFAHTSLCGQCGCGDCQHSKMGIHRKYFSGPREIENDKAPCFMQPEQWYPIDAEALYYYKVDRRARG